MNDSIQFLKFKRRGHDPEQLFDKIYSKREEELKKKVAETANSTISKLEKLQQDVSAVVKSIETAEVLKPSEDMLEALKMQNQQLSGVVEKTKAAINQTLQNNESKRQNIIALKHDLESLQENYSKLRTSNHDARITNLAEVLCKNTSLITKSRLDNGSEINTYSIPGKNRH